MGHIICDLTVVTASDVDLSRILEIMRATRSSRSKRSQQYSGKEGKRDGLGALETFAKASGPIMASVLHLLMFLE
jgi:hypothetical protein